MAMRNDAPSISRLKEIIRSENSQGRRVTWRWLIKQAGLTQVTLSRRISEDERIGAREMAENREYTTLGSILKENRGRYPGFRTPRKACKSAKNTSSEMLMLFNELRIRALNGEKVWLSRLLLAKRMGYSSEDPILQYLGPGTRLRKQFLAAQLKIERLVRKNHPNFSRPKIDPFPNNSQVLAAISKAKKRLSVGDIADKFGVGYRTLYRRFESNKALFSALREHNKAFPGQNNNIGRPPNIDRTEIVSAIVMVFEGRRHGRMPDITPRDVAGQFYGKDANSVNYAIKTNNDVQTLLHYANMALSAMRMAKGIATKRIPLSQEKVESAIAGLDPFTPITLKKLARGILGMRFRKLRDFMDENPETWEKFIGKKAEIDANLAAAQDGKLAGEISRALSGWTGKIDLKSLAKTLGRSYSGVSGCIRSHPELQESYTSLQMERNPDPVKLKTFSNDAKVPETPLAMRRGYPLFPRNQEKRKIPGVPAAAKKHLHVN